MLPLFRYAFKGTAPKLVVAVFCSLVAGLANVALVDQLTRAAEGQEVRILVFLGLLVCLVGTILISRTIVAKLAATRAYDLTMDLSRRLITMPIRDLERIGADDTLATLTNDIPRIADGVQEFASLLTSVLTLILLFVYAFYVSVTGGLLLVGVGVVLFVIGIVQVYFLQGNIGALRAAVDDFYAHFRDLLFGAKELRLAQRAQDDFLANGLAPTARRSMQASMGMGIKRALFGSATTVLIFLSAAAIISLGYATFGMPLPQVRAFVLLILFAAGPGAGILYSGATLQVTAVCYRRVKAIGLDVADAQRPEPASTDSMLPRALLELEDARLEYGDAASGEGFTLGPLDLTFTPGKITFIVGGNGSGKSTLIKVLSGIYRLDRGSLHLNGVLVEDSTAVWYRDHVAIVFSDFWLFGKLWGFRDADPELIRTMLHTLALHDKTQVDGGAFSTTQLSAGQRRRLALISALVQDRPIYIFDEWAADQDPKFTRYFYRTLLPQLRERGKTIIVVTHDEAYFDVADQRIKLEYGQETRDRTGQFMIRLTGEDGGPSVVERK